MLYLSQLVSIFLAFIIYYLSLLCPCGLCPRWVVFNLNFKVPVSSVREGMYEGGNIRKAKWGISPPRSI